MSGKYLQTYLETLTRNISRKISQNISGKYSQTGSGKYLENFILKLVLFQFNKFSCFSISIA